MVDTDREQYLKAARSTDVFNSQEMGVLAEVLQDCQDNPGINYFLFDEKHNNVIAGFVIFGKAPLTQFSWDIYWLAVDKSFHGKGVGKKLLNKVESFLMKDNLNIVLRIETSARRQYLHARDLYLKQGFKEVGRVPSFYSVQDDLVIFYKQFKVM